MKMHDSHQVAYTDGIERTQNFRFTATSKLIDIFSNAIYSDKIRAIIRELGCNAYDAHIEAERGVRAKDGSWIVPPRSGTSKKPFDVRLPTRIEPHFSIRDYGVGLSDSAIDDLYTVYGESSKTASNDEIGGFGLGSKSPFCYTESFGVTSFFNGKKRTYMAVKDKGFPKILRPEGYEEDTDEPNGLEVTLSVKDADVESFWSKSGQVFEYFPVRPNVVNKNRQVVYPSKPDILMEGKGWRIFNRHNFNQIGALMGVVEYPINLSDMMNARQLDQTTRAVLSCPGLQIDFNIGDLSMQPSREQLSYDDDTTKLITQRAHLIRDEIVKMVNNRLIGCKTLWEAHLALNKLLSESSTSRVITTMEKEGAIKFTWNGKNIPRSIELSLQSYQKEITYDVKVKNPLTGAVTVTQEMKDIPTVYVRKRNSDMPQNSIFSANTHQRSLHFSGYDSDKDIFAIDDVRNSRKVKAHMAGWAKEIEDANNTNQYTSGYRYQTRNLWVICADLKETVDEILEKLGNPPTVLVSSLPIEQIAVQKKDKRKVFRYKIPSKHQPRTKDFWESVAIDVEDDSKVRYYVRLVNHVPHLTDRNGADQDLNTHRFRNAIDFLVNQLKIDVTNIYGVNPDFLRSIKDMKHWVELFEFAKDPLQKMANQMSSSPNLSSEIDYICSDGLDSRSFTRFKEHLKLPIPVGENALLDEMREMAKVLEHQISLRNSHFDDHLFDLLIDIATLTTPNLSPDWKKLATRFNEEYPMARFFFAQTEWKSSPKEIKTLVEYIRDTDALQKLVNEMASVPTNVLTVVSINPEDDPEEIALAANA